MPGIPVRTFKEGSLATRIRQIGNVELWRDEYTDAKLKVETANAFAQPRTQFNSSRDRMDYEAKYVIPLQTLTKAISIAPIMLEMAIARLTSLMMDRDVSAMGISSQDRETSLNNTVLALFKYFNLPADLRTLDRHDPQWLNVERICGIYERALDGLQQPYKIFLYESQNSGTSQSALGFVRHAKVEGTEPIHEYFRTAPSEDGHIVYPTFHMTSDIHIRLDALKQADGKKEQLDGKKDGVARKDSLVAALLIHEATHKWANTLDICYKWDTIAQRNKHLEWDKAQKDRKSSKASSLDYAIKTGAQPALNRPGQSKPLLPLAKAGVTRESWVYNADSYSCAARRLWKETSKGTGEFKWED